MTESNGEIVNINFDSELLYVNYITLKDLCENNAGYFKNDTSHLGKSIHSTCLLIVNNLDSIRPLVEYFRSIYHKYDFDESTPGNGYRSYVMMVDTFVLYGIKINRQICHSRNSYFFRKGTALKELEACEQGLSSLGQMLTHFLTLVEWSESGCLYPREEHPPEELLAKAQNLNQFCFYGRCLGFQFCESMQTVLKGLGILMASFSEIYYSNGGMFGRATSSLWNSSKYLVNPELRAKRIVNISQYASVNFCKQFWFLGEMETMKRLPSFVSPSVIMNRIIVIPPEPMTAHRLDGTTFDVPIPSAHTGLSPLSVRLMSSVKRVGMLGEATSKNLAPVAEGFMFHCHGGGFVAQSSRSHETYLCQWAKAIDVPILSVDYSLAPEAPFPRALEDTFYAYCWALNNLNILGTTGQRIVAGGDSAGGNLVLGLTIKCIMEGVRPPDGLFLAYVPVIVSIVPSPARLLCLMDPLLPLGFLTGCLRAYACTPEAYEAAVKGFEEKLRHRSRRSSSNSKKGNSNSNSRSNSIDKGVVRDLDTGGCVAMTNGNKSSNGAVINNETDAVIDSDMNGSGAKKSNYVAGFLDKYVNNDSNVDNKITNNGGRPIVINSQQSTDDDDMFDAPVPFPPSMPLPQQDEQDNNKTSDVKGSTSTLGNFANAIGSTFFSLSGNSGSDQQHAADENNLNTSNDSNELKKSNSSPSIGDDFEEVMLPCPLEMLKFEVPRNPLLSPYYANEEILKQFPPVSVMTLHMDPCLDDCVEFAKKMKRLGNKVTLDILEGLPHGFLNFSLLSKEAYEGSKKCCDRIKGLLAFPPPVTATEAQEDT